MESPDINTTADGDDLPPGGTWRDRMGDGWMRVFLFDHWFGVATLLFFCFLIFLGLFLTKIWTATPEWMSPPIKISGLDMAQSWSLARRAQELAQQGNMTEAIVNWRSASYHNPGQPEIARAMLRSIVALPKPDRRFTAIGYDRSLWLLKLTRTNIDDVAIAGRFLRKYEIDDWLLQLTGSLTNRMPATLAADILVASFNRGQMDRFGKFWESQNAAQSTNQILQLYHLAWEAGWGPPVGMQAARRRLAELQSTSTGEAAETVRRLQMFVAFQLNDVAGFRTAFEWLIDHHAEKVNEHVNFWRLLVRSGRRSEAQELARRFSRPPETLLDAIGLGSTFAELGLPTVAVDFVLAQLKDYPFSSDLWMLLAQQRIQLKAWTELRQTAMNMRNEPALQGKMTGVSSFIEGVVNLRTGDPTSAKAFFETASTGTFPKPLDAYSVASEILQFGFPEAAVKLLKSVETTYATNVNFWHQLTTAAYGSRQMDLTLTAARKTWELAPNMPVYMNNYSAVLLALRERPDEAINLTFRLVSRFPQNKAYQVNHCLALIQNGRLEEAENLLKRFNPATLGAVEAASVNLGWFELYLQRGNLELARAIYPRIDGTHLMESQTQWLATQIKKIGKG